MKRFPYDGIVVAVAAILSSGHWAQAASDTWNDATATLWQSPSSWLSGTQYPGLNTNVYTSPDEATFSTTGAAGTIDLGGTINIRSLIFGASGGNAAAFSIGNANDTLNFTSGGGITINTGVTTAQTIGTTGTVVNLSNDGNANTAFTNNGTGLLTIAGNIAAKVGSGDGVLTVGGSGDTTISGTITEPGSGSSALLKTGAGTLTLSKDSEWSGFGAQSPNFNSPLIAREGTLLLNGGTHTVNGELVIGGLPANGGAGQNAKVQIDAGALNVTRYLSVGRGNGVGGVSSDLVANNAATITAQDFSAGFNGGDGSNRPKGSITLNGTSTFTTNDVFHLGESAGSDTTFTMNGSSRLFANGGNNRNYIGNAGNGTLIVNGTSAATFASDAFLGRSGTSVGTIAMNGGTFNFATSDERWLYLGGNDTSRGQIDLISGSMNMLNSSKIRMGTGNSTGANVITQTGGSLTFYSNGGTTPTVGGGGELDMQFTASSNTNNTYNLNGGTLTVPTIVSTNNTGTRTFNFNGGTLKAAASGVLMDLGSDNAVANVRNGGAIIDTNGLNVSVSQALLHSDVALDAAIDGGLTKNGAGTLTLTGANTYTGTTNITAGTLQLGDGTFGKDGSINTSAAIANSGVLAYNLFDSGSYGGVISGSGSLTKAGAGTLTLSGSNTFTGGASVTAGTLISDFNTIALGANVAASTVSVASGSVVQLNINASSFYEQTFSGAGKLLLNFSGGGDTVIKNFNNFTGILELAVQGGGATGNKLAVAGQAGLSGATLVINNNTQVFVIEGTTNFANITMVGGGNTENRGAVRLRPGTLGGNILLLGNTTIGNEGGTLSGNISTGVAGTSTLTMGTVETAGNANLSANLSNGTGVLALTTFRGETTLSGSNNIYSGATNIGGGSTLKAGSTGAFSANSAVIFANTTSATVDTTGYNTTVGSLAGGGTEGGNIILGTATLTTGGDGTSTSFAGTISGTGGGLRKIGSGTQTITGTSSYSGTTVITSGTLLAGSNKALGDTNSVSISGGRLDVRGSTVGSLTLGANAALSLSSGTITLQLGSSFDQIVSSGGSGAFSMTGGTLALDVSGEGFSYNGTYNVFSGFGGANTITNLSFSGYDSTNYSARLSNSGTISFDSVTPVPEPSTWVGAGLITGLALWSQRRRLRRGRPCMQA